MIKKTCEDCGRDFLAVRKSQRFCSRKCSNMSQKSGIIRKEKEEKFLKKYGVKNPFQSEEIKKKISDVSIERYGVDNPAKSDIIKERSKKTCQRKYGTDFAGASKSNRIKIKDTLRKKYGENINSTFDIPDVQQKCKNRMIEKYGVDCLFKTEGYYEKVKEKMLKTYGVSNAFSLPHSKQLAHSKEANKKSFETMKKNGSFTESKIEREIICKIQELFGDVVRHVHVNGWSIDAKIVSSETYIQIDGVYWHGLDRPIEIISKSSIKIDKIIYAKWLRDREQIKWFMENDKKLIRITDLEWKHAKNKNSFLNLKIFN